MEQFIRHIDSSTKLPSEKLTVNRFEKIVIFTDLTSRITNRYFLKAAALNSGGAILNLGGDSVSNGFLTPSLNKLFI